MASIRDWLYSQQYQIALALQRLSEPLAAQTLESSQVSLLGGFQAPLDKWEPPYQEVLQAFQELDPDYRLREPFNWDWRNVQYHFVGGHLCPAIEPGTVSRDFGPFRVYEVHGKQDDVPLAPSSDVCLVLAEEEVFRLGNSAQSEMDSSALLAFVDFWMARREQAIQKIKEYLQTIEEPEHRALLQRVLSQQESSLLSVAHAVDELKRSNHAI
jgi:hypothetical protein